MSKELESPTPLAYAITTGSSNRTDFYSYGEWNGVRVLVHEGLWAEQGPCSGHELEPMTHYGEDTGSLYCPHCVGSVTQAERQRAERG